VQALHTRKSPSSKLAIIAHSATIWAKQGGKGRIRCPKRGDDMARGAVPGLASIAQLWGLMRASLLTMKGRFSTTSMETRSREVLIEPAAAC